MFILVPGAVEFTYERLLTQDSGLEFLFSIYAKMKQILTLA
jgi:hypothetical protein